MPTLLDLLGVVGPGDLDGDSLLPSIAEGVPPVEKSVFSQYSGLLQLGPIKRTVITSRYKYTYEPADAPELYDLEKDPLEMKNLSRDVSCRDVMKRLHEECEAWFRNRDDWVIY